MLSVNDWMVINTITYKIMSVNDIDEMRMDIMNIVKKIIDFDSASFYLASSMSDSTLAHPLSINYSEEDMNEYLSTYQYEDYSIGLMSTGENITYKESDIIQEDLRIQSQYYKDVYIAQGWHYSLHLNLSYNEHFVGVLSLFRNKGEEDFDHDDIFICDMFKKHLAYRIACYLESEISHGPTIEQLAVTYDFSPRELSIAQFLVKGYSSSDIADTLDISENTVKKHTSNIYKKAGIGSQIQLIQMLS